MLNGIFTCRIHSESRGGPNVELVAKNNSMCCYFWDKLDTRERQETYKCRSYVNNATCLWQLSTGTNPHSNLQLPQRPVQSKS